MARTALRRMALDDAGLSWLEWGPKDGRTLVISPGLSDGIWPVRRDLGPYLRWYFRAFRDFRVIFASRREPTPMRHDTRQMAADLAALVRRLDSGPVSVMGISMGGFVAQWLAAEHPELVDRLLLVTTVGHVDEGAERVMARWEGFARDRRWTDYTRYCIETSYTGGAPPLRYRTMAALADVLPLVPRPLSVDRYLACSWACRHHDAREALGAISAPTLALGGTTDRITRPEKMQEMVEAIPDARLLLFDRAGHGAPEQRGRELHAAAREFALGSWPAAAAVERRAVVA